MRVVLDCNVLISAGLNPGICRTVLHEVLESHQCILSAQILQEYVTVARRKRFAGVQETLISLIQVVSRNAAFVAPEPSTLHLPDSKDRPYLDAALAAKAAVLITGTKNISPIPRIRVCGSSRRGSSGEPGARKTAVGRRVGEEGASAPALPATTTVDANHLQPAAKAA